MEVDLSRHILPNIFCVIAVLSILFPQWQRVSRLPLHWDKRICWRRLPRLDTAMHYHCKIAESVANQRLPNDLQFRLLMLAFVGGLLRRLSITESVMYWPIIAVHNIELNCSLWQHWWQYHQSIALISNIGDIVTPASCSAEHLRIILSPAGSRQVIVRSLQLVNAVVRAW